MPKIKQALIEKLQSHLGIGKSRVYKLIETKMNETHLDRHLAAIALAAEKGLNIARYATSEELAVIRGGGSHGLPHTAEVAIPSHIPRTTHRLMHPLVIRLDFISSDDLRKILVRDISELNLIRSRGYDDAPKACMVLSGSIVEAMLLDCLLQREFDAKAIASGLPKKLSNKIGDWDLADMVNVAIHLNPPLLPDDAITGANQLRQWRNLIHPGRELKDAKSKRIMPTPGRARNAISFLHFIAEELNS